jgi:hypothetical protein
VQISEETIKRFQEIFEKDYGRELSTKEVYEAACNLLGFFDLLLRIDRRINPHRYKSKKKEDLIKLVSK